MSSIADSGAEIGRYWAVAAANVLREKRFWSRKEATYSIDALQPAVATVCVAQNVSGQEIQDQVLWFANLTSKEAGETDANFVFRAVNDEDAIAKVLDRLNSTSEPDVLWFNAVEGLGSTLHAVATFPDTGLTNISQIYSCSFDSRYFPATTSSKRTRVKISYSDSLDDYIRHGVINTDYQRINLAADWAQYLNPTINSEGQTAFGQMAKTAGMWNATTTPDQGFTEVIVEGILATMTLNGIARSGYDIPIAGRAKGTNTSNPDPFPPPTAFYSELLPRNYLGGGGDAYEITDAELKTATPFKVRVLVLGYAYTHRSVTQIAAITVLLLYSALAIFHFIYTMKTGEQSNAWDTTPELVALAMNSARTEKLKNTGAGIETSNVFKEMVRIEVKEGDRLEFVFEDTQDITDAFERNKHYAQELFYIEF
ncbi:hypothetical protein SLS58_010919 [Diplodia intermedia]|uniref:Uncharacterized protein n=1 Tax=Diplodia intermedia TaxID=856260 RepID=A0ABR3T2R8_9PEZI